MPPRLQATSVSISTDDPRGLAAFYAQLLDVELSGEQGPGPGEAATAGWAQLRTTHDHGRLTINFEYDPAYVAPVWPSTPGRQQPQAHLDFWVDDLVVAVAWAVECGAAQVTWQPQDDVRVLLDPHGHPFCLFL